MKEALLDTDILSEFLRGNESVINNAAKYVEEFGMFNLSIISYYEILNGLLYKDAKKQMKKFEEFVSLNNVVLLTKDTVKESAKIQAYLRKKGTVIGHTDTLIAGISISNNLQLITNNTEHFKRIKGLDYANWNK